MQWMSHSESCKVHVEFKKQTSREQPTAGTCVAVHALHTVKG